MNTALHFHIDDRVVMISQPREPSPTMPAVGSEYEDIGTVTYVDGGRGYIHVRWDHAYSTHAYYPSALELHDIYTNTVLKPEPNQAFRRQKNDQLDKVKELKEQPYVGEDGKITLSYAEWKEQQGIS